jgi:hypothetical protein
VFGVATYEDEHSDTVELLEGDHDCFDAVKAGSLLLHLWGDIKATV